jgi:hypothetical protein
VQQAIRLLRARNLDSRNYFGQVAYGADQRMNVIRHYDPASQFIKSAVLTGEKHVDDGTGHIRVDQPLWAGCSRIQHLIEGREFGPFGGPEVRYSLHRERAGETPRQEAGFSGLVPMGQVGMGRNHVQGVSRQAGNSPEIGERGW